MLKHILKNYSWIPHSSQSTKRLWEYALGYRDSKQTSKFGLGGRGLRGRVLGGRGRALGAHGYSQSLRFSLLFREMMALAALRSTYQRGRARTHHP